jgi:hypothetical protein
MNCQSCNTTIDYRYQTNCANCGSIIERATSVPEIPNTDPPPAETDHPWTRRAVNTAYVLISSFVGMISGAVVIYFCTAFVFLAFVESSGNASHDCARGTAIGVLAILSGGFLGTIGGSVLATLNPLCKP